MTDSAYSILVLSGLVAGSASSFIVDMETLPLFLLFPAISILGKTWKGTLRILLLVTAPAFVLILGAVTDDSLLVERALRWIAAIIAGVSMAGALGASRASEFLFSVSKKMSFEGFPESLALIISLAGPFSERIKAVFIENRKNGRCYSDSLTAALSSVNGIELPDTCVRSGQNIFSTIAACLAWLLLLSAIMEVL